MLLPPLTGSHILGLAVWDGDGSRAYTYMNSFGSGAYLINQDFIASTAGSAEVNLPKQG